MQHSTARRMKAQPPSKSRLRVVSPAKEIQELRSRLAEAEETLQAIQSGDVDAVVVSGSGGQKVFTLHGAEYAYRALVEAMNDGAASIAPDRTILYCNRRVSSLLQLPSENVIGSPIDAFIAHADQLAFAALFERALAGTGGTAEIQLRLADGSFAPAYLSLSRVQMDSDPAVCMTITDLREQKRRDELIAAGNLARSILQNACEAIAVCDQDGRVILANEALCDLCGRNPLFENLDHILHMELPTASERSRTGAARFLPLPGTRNGDTIRAEQVTFRRSDGQVFWLLVTAGPLHSGSEVIGSVLTLMDNTRHKLAEKALLRSEKLAATGQLAATIAHEINNPLTGVLNLLYLITKEKNVSQGRQYAALALKEMARVSHITKQTLGFYRCSEQPEKIVMSEMLGEIVSLFKKEFQAKHITSDTAYRIPGDICGYSGEMRQVFSNLIRNAIEAVPTGGRIRLGIHPARRQKKDGIAVFVCDNGGGVAPELRRRIFEPFFTTKKGRGTGLGLWVASDLVQKHGGIIRVRSSRSPGRSGTCFYVFLPTAVAATGRSSSASA